MDGLPAYDDLPPLLPTDRELRLRPWEPADVPAVLAACLQPSTQRWIDAFRGYDEGSARRYVLGAPDAWARRRHLRLCLTDGSDTVLGAADLDDLSVQHVSADLGWWVAPAARGRGAGVRGGRLLVALGLGHLGLARLTARILAPNTLSRWVAAGAGLHLESVAASADVDAGGGARSDRETWRLLASEARLDPQPDLTAGRLHLRPLVPSDAAAVHAACQDPEVARWTTVPSPYTLAAAEDFCGRRTLGEWAGGAGATWAVVDAVDGRLLAVVGLRLHGMGVAEVGFWAVAAERGRGVATDAVRAVCGWALGTGWCCVVEWRALPGNAASLRVAQKCGFTVEGTLRSRLVVRDGPRQDVVVAALLPGELR